MKLDWKLILNVSIAIAIMAVIGKLVLDRVIEKIPHYEEMIN